MDRAISWLFVFASLSLRFQVVALLIDGVTGLIQSP
jgi:hypothetical protein